MVSGLLIFIFAVVIWFGYRDVKGVVRYFPLNKEIVFIDLGSDLEIFQKDAGYIIQGESWSKTSKKVYLRQDVNLLFQNGFLIAMTYPWEKQTDWMVNQIQKPLKSDAVYTLLSYHHAEIHENDQISSSQAVTSDRLYVKYFQDNWDAFHQPQNARQKQMMESMDQMNQDKRKALLDQAMKELNINQINYEIYDLDTFSLQEKASKVISEEQWPIVLGGVWEGLYRSYFVRITKDQLSYFSPPMPWILIDRNGTHLLIVYQQYNGQYSKLIMEI